MGNRLDQRSETDYVAHLASASSICQAPHSLLGSRYNPKAANNVSALMPHDQSEVTSPALVLFIFLIEAFILAAVSQLSW